jgi:hypothetical protein
MALRNLRSGLSGITATQEPVVPLMDSPMQKPAPQNDSDVEERSLESEPASPEPTESCTAIAVTQEIDLVELIQKQGPITSEEVLTTLAESEEVRKWALRLTAKFQKPKRELSQETKSILAPPKVSSEASLVAQITQIMELSEDLTTGELLTRSQLNKLELLTSKSFEFQGGTALRTLFKFLLTPRAAHFPKGDKEDTDDTISKNERRVIELREAAQLSIRLFARRPTGNGGLSMRDIVKLHAEVAMSKAWQILATFGTTADAVYDQSGRWTTLVKDIEIILWHTDRIDFSEFFTTQKLKTWLIDAKGPRLQDIPARLSSLRKLLFPTGTMEVQDPETYDSYGLEILDELTFDNWNPNKTPAEPEEIAKDCEHIPKKRGLDLATEMGIRPTKKPRQIESVPTGPNKTNPVIDQLVQDLLNEQSRALEDDLSNFY